MATIPFASAFVFVETASDSGRGQKAGNVHRVIDKLLENNTDNLVLAHAILGDSDLLAYIQADTPENVKKILHDEIRELKLDRHNSIKETQTHIVTSAHGQDLSRAEHQSADNGDVFVWIMATTNQADPSSDILVNGLLRDDRVIAVFPVLGQFDVFILARASGLLDLQDLIDESIRAKNMIIKTQSNLVL